MLGVGTLKCGSLGCGGRGSAGGHSGQRGHGGSGDCDGRTIVVSVKLIGQRDINRTDRMIVFVSGVVLVVVASASVSVHCNADVRSPQLLNTNVTKEEF